jgi:(4-(4-[2-(gamma-L-glutamylamino)ethyl]phenoxymethyl)furan-2-yl)methanamine synthase
MNWLAFDIGGAHLKMADGLGFAAHHSFPMWRHHRRLAGELRTLIAEAPASDHLAVTMTGELADCFESKSQGVKYIISAVQEAADGRHLRVYLTDGRLVAPTVALRTPLLAAAANWRALAAFAARYAPSGDALLLDIGSTTCDAIPLRDGVVIAQGANDTERLLAGELIYTGVERTPLFGLTDRLPYRDQNCPVAAEVFSTTRDVYVLTGELPESSTNVDTPDGRPATKVAARTRIGRMIGAPEENFNHRDAVQMAQAVRAAQVRKIVDQSRQVLARLEEPPATVIACGQGEFLVDSVLEGLELQRITRISLAEKLAPSVSRAAPAHALAVLAREG